MNEYTQYPEWCRIVECSAPIINGVSLCHHPQEQDNFQGHTSGED